MMEPAGAANPLRVPLASIRTASELPPEADVVVIGGGIVGVCTAYFLTATGQSVVLLEKGLIGAEQSSRNWGWCRQQNRDARELPMATRSLELWDLMMEAIGPRLGFRRCGLLYLSNDERELEAWARWRDFAAGEGVTTHMLSARDARERGAATGRQWKGGVFSPSDGIADPSTAAPAIAEATMARGGIVLQRCAARGIDREAGRVSGVVTEKGTIRTRTAVMAGGAWASSFCNQLGIRFPQSSVRASIASVTAASGVPDALHTRDVSVTARANGSHTLAISGLAKVDPTLQTLCFARDFLPMLARRLGAVKPGGLQALRLGHEQRGAWALDRPTPMERTRILDPEPDRRCIAETVRRARTLLPALDGSRIEAAWAGYIDSTPDGVPAIGETAVGGFVLAAGCSGHGFGIGPGLGRMVADLVSGNAPTLDPSPYHPGRLARSAWGKVSDF